MSSLDDMLRENFLTEQNRVQWEDLGGAVIGGLLFQVFAFLIAIPRGAAAAIDGFVGLVKAALMGGIRQLSATITTEAAAAWTPFDAGLFSLVLNLVVVIAAFTIVVWGFRVITSG